MIIIWPKFTPNARNESFKKQNQKLNLNKFRKSSAPDFAYAKAQNYAPFQILLILIIYLIAIPNLKFRCLS